MAHEGEKENKKAEISHITIKRAENGFIYHACAEWEMTEPAKNMDKDYVYESLDDVLSAVKDDLESPHLREGGKKPPLGSGERFEELEGKLATKGAKDPAALAAFIGRKKFGKSKFQALAATGRRRMFK